MKSTVAAAKFLQSGQVLVTGGGLPAKTAETSAAVTFIFRNFKT